MEKYISPADKEKQDKYREKNKEYVTSLANKLQRKLIAQVVTYGCQQNEADSEIIAGELASYGYDIVLGEADIIPDAVILNTCAVREHAELKALSKTGNLKVKKEQNPYLLTGIGGCMVQQEHRQSDIKKSYPYIDFLFGTNSLPHFPEIFNKAINREKRIFHVEENDGYLPEGMCAYRHAEERASVSIMYGCNNFCSYCIVPYVRGRERSREKCAILSEIKELVKNGCKEITLLGQNVNSYGKELSPPVSFAALCDEICKIDGDFTVKFMTSHPKDVSDELIDCIAKNEKMAPMIHFPIQSGSDRILSAMNRKYTFAEYYEKVKKIREKIPEASISADIIVGFPGESDEDFELTLEAMRKIRYDAVYSFAYSKRSGTPAAKFESQVSEDVKKERLKKLIELQTDIMGDINKSFFGKTVVAYVEGISKKNKDMISARTATGKIIHLKATSGIKPGDKINVKITKTMSYQMYGELQKGEI